MHAKFLHSNIYVTDLSKAMDFYDKSLGLKEIDRLETDKFILVYLGDGQSDHCLELTWIKQGPDSYNLGDNTFHIAFGVEDMEQAHRVHQDMNCICYENEAMGIYFIADPDGNWLEVMPVK